MYLSDYTKYSYNLQFSRFVLSVFVILSHSFPLSTGKTTGEWLFILSKGQLTFGTIAVTAFFLCGGYYATKSMIEKNDNYYLLLRLIRLIPELLLVVLACTIMGSFVSSLTLLEYFTNIKTYKYLLNGFMILIHELPGVFLTNIYTATINGALWTLPVEYICCCGLFIGVKFGLHKIKRFFIFVTLLAVAGIIIGQTNYISGELKSTFIACIFFGLGVIFYIFRRYIFLSRPVFFVCSILTVVLFVIGHSRIAMYLLFPYLWFYLWMNDKRMPKYLCALGRYSYAIYLWGFPIQQTVVHFFGGSMNPIICFLMSTPIAILFAIPTNKIATYLSTKLRIVTKKNI